MKDKLSVLRTFKFFTKHKSRIDDFFYGYTYPFILAAVAALCFAISGCAPLIGFSVMAACVAFVLIYYKDLTPFLPPAFLFIMCFNNLDFMYTAYFYTLCAIVGVCLIAHFFIYPIKLYFGRMFFVLLAVSSALFLGGVLSNYLDDYLQGLSGAIATGPAVLLVYFIFSNYMNPPDGFNLKKYVCVLVITTAFTAVFTVVVYYIKRNAFTEGDVGYANTNNIASLILLALPCSCYLLANTKRQLVCFTVTVLLFVGMLITKSDGALAVMCLCTPFLIYCVYKKTPEKRKFVILCSVVILGVCCFLLLLSLKRNLLTILNTNDHGRLRIYTKALELFKTFPVFGVGLGYLDLNTFDPLLVGIRQNNFHCSILHVMATMGTYGLLCYLLYYVERFKIFTGNGSAFNCFMTYSFTMFEMYALIDTGEFNLFPLLFILTLLICVTEFINKNQSKNESIKTNFYRLNGDKIFFK